MRPGASQHARLPRSRFTREELRTVAVWGRGDDHTVPGGREYPDLGGLIECLLGDEGLARLADERGVDLERLRECVARHCR